MKPLEIKVYGETSPLGPPPGSAPDCRPKKVASAHVQVHNFSGNSKFTGLNFHGKIMWFLICKACCALESLSESRLDKLILLMISFGVLQTPICFSL